MDRLMNWLGYVPKRYLRVAWFDASMIARSVDAPLLEERGDRWLTEAELHAIISRVDAGQRALSKANGESGT